MDYVLIVFLSAVFGAGVGSIATLLGHNYICERNLRRTVMNEFPDAERHL